MNDKSIPDDDARFGMRTDRHAEIGAGLCSYGNADPETQITEGTNMIHNVKELNKFKNQYRKSMEAQYKKVLVCAGTGCVAGGSLEIFSRLKDLAQEAGLPVSVELKKEPHEEIAFKKERMPRILRNGTALRIEPFDWLYVKVKPEDCEEILEKRASGVTSR